MTLSRKRTPNPYDHLPERHPMVLTSADFEDDQELPYLHAHGSAGGANLSPQLSWSGEPEGTRSFEGPPVGRTLDYAA
jgi:phosphatidylethanolamine-binding protein (PEBP) family uncharacterized protein